MWRSVLAVVLLPSLTAAQAPPEVRPDVLEETVSAIPSGPPPDAHVREPFYRAYTRYDAIRRGREEGAAVQLVIHGWVTTSKSGFSGVVPLTMNFEPLDGIEIKSIHYPEVMKSAYKFRGKSVKATGLPYIYFKIRADRDAPLGARVLKAKVTFQKVPTGVDALPVQQVDVQIPLTIVEHDAPVHKAELPSTPTPVALIVVLIVAMPVLFALFIPALLICAAAMNCPD